MAAPLPQWQYVVIADDSGSMGQGFTPVGLRRCGEESLSRYKVLGGDVGTLMGLVGEESVKVYFHGGAMVEGGERVAKKFLAEPKGATKMVETLSAAVNDVVNSPSLRETLIVVTTDGAPACGTKTLKKYLRSLSRHPIKFLFVPYTLSTGGTEYLRKLSKLPNCSVAQSYTAFSQSESRLHGGVRPTNAEWLRTSVLAAVVSEEPHKKESVCIPGCSLM